MVLYRIGSLYLSMIEPCRERIFVNELWQNKAARRSLPPAHFTYIYWDSPFRIADATAFASSIVSAWLAKTTIPVSPANHNNVTHRIRIAAARIPFPPFPLPYDRSQTELYSPLSLEAPVAASSARIRTVTEVPTPSCDETLRPYPSPAYSLIRSFTLNKP